MKVGFYSWLPFHGAMLDPVYDVLKDQFSCLRSADADEILRFAPQVLVAADGVYELFRPRLPETFIVFTRHGFAHKQDLARNMGGADAACVSSGDVRDDLLARGLRPRFGYWVTGFVPMDEVVRLARAPDPALAPPAFAGGDATLLYAPTYNPELSAEEVLGDGWLPALRQRLPRLNVIIKPHPVAAERQPQSLARWRRFAAGDSRVLLVEDPGASVFRYFGLADVLLSDVSSVIFYFLALDRPIVLVDNPRRQQTTYHSPTGPESAWRDLGQAIADVAELPGAIEQALQSPRRHAERRAHYRARVFGELLDGHAAERVAQHIRTLVRPSPAQAPWVQACWQALGRLNRGPPGSADLLAEAYEIGTNIMAPAAEGPSGWT